ncbi:MAG: alpha/beta hydrolase [Chlorobi bacterium]|nr:alpha/beta hydrolase [Chlorobiota bacterium]
MRTHIFLILMFFMVNISIRAQYETVKLYPKDIIPGSILKPSYSEKSEKGPDGITRVYRVTSPELIVFRAKKEKANGTAVIICPGGGYHILAIDHEGYRVAEWLNTLGITAFVLKYRLPDDEIMTDKSTGPLQDAQAAIRIVRQNAKKYNINPDKTGIMGFSAGGHLASTLSTHFNDTVYSCDKTINTRPDFSILVYPVISMDKSITHMGTRINLLGNKPSHETIKYFSNEKAVTDNTPPAFIVHAADDKAVPVENSISYFLALKKHNISAELHIYEKGGHGFGIKNLKGTVKYWTNDCEHWMKANNLIK